MASNPPNPSDAIERRSSPVFRQRAQLAYEALRKMISAHGGTDIVADLSGSPKVEDVMRTNPELVVALLESAWKIKNKEEMAEFFQRMEGGGEVESPDEPIAPCGRTFDTTVVSHLFGCARLYFKRCENEWVIDQLANPKNLPKEATGGPINFLRRMIGMKPQVKEGVVRANYPGRELYETIKPHLKHRDQFKLVPAYAGLSSKAASVVGDILEDLRSTKAIANACRLEPDTLVNAKACAYAYAEGEIFAKAKKGSRKSLRELQRDNELTGQVKVRAAAVFADILNTHLESLSFVAEHKAGAEAAVRALAPLYGEETWSVMGEENAVDNIINCPKAVAPVLRKKAKYIHVRVSKALEQLQYPDIGRDLMKMTVKSYGDDDLSHILSAEPCIKVWEGVPGIFNNQFKYQHDAKGVDKEIKNYDDLKTAAEPIFGELSSALSAARSKARRAAAEAEEEA